VAHLFPPNALREQAARISTDSILPFVSVIQQWCDDYHEGTLPKDNETSREQAYNQHVFIQILGYRWKPDKNPTFAPKDPALAGLTPDAVIAVFGPERPTSVSAVVELKGTSVNLDKPQAREGHLTPVQQGFKYAVLYRRCPFVIVSNYWEFRLYADNIFDYEVWTLDDLTDPTDDYIKFKTWYHLLRADNFVALQESATQRLLSDIRIEAEKIGKRFYAQYKQARLEFLRQLWRDNESVREDIDLAIRVTQKVMDRIVFAAFAEDTGLLPDNTIARVEKSASSGGFTMPLWQVLQAFFHAVDKGDEQLGIPIGYNGGLFANDPELDSLVISDDHLRSVLALTTFDFSQELTVTVLGHILEQSITDLEEIRLRVDESHGVESVVESQRKKEGIYYTPDHIVHYIVDNSLGRYLREQEQRCLDIAGARSNRKLSEQVADARWKKAYEAYQHILQHIRVLDPACGSGAFLVGALELLQAENQRVGAILGGTLLSLDAFAQATLRDNLYGVDLNAEGVEITKLSLWLKTAQKGHVLSALDHNIRVGNSLVDDAAQAGDKAFDWGAAFPEVMSDGGFDVVIGNPPYVDSENMSRNDPEQRAWLAKHYATAKGNWDLYVVFIEQALKLVRPSGIISMIVPNKVLSAPYASTLRRLVEREHRLVGLTDVSHDGVFDVDVYPVILAIASDRETARELMVQEGITDRQAFVELSGDNIPANWGLLLPSTEQVSFHVPTVALSEWFDTWSAAPVNEAYQMREALVENPAAVSGKVINTGTIDPYTALWGFKMMQYIKHQFRFPAVVIDYLPKSKEWYGQDKLIVNGMGVVLECVYSEGDTYFPAVQTIVVTPKHDSPLSLMALCALLNSRYVSYLFTQENRQNSMAGGYISITPGQIAAIRLPKSADGVSDELAALATRLGADSMALLEHTRRLTDAVRSMGVGGWPKKLAHWWTLEFAQFSDILKPGRLTAQQRLDFSDLFHTAADLAMPIARSVDENIARVDAIVDALYGVASYG